MELNEIMRNAGITGAGGAGFPSYAKLAPGADTLVVNGAECEPLLYTDYELLKNSLSTVTSGIRSVMEHLKISRAVLAIKSHTAEALELYDGDVLSEGITVKALPDVYPIGDEISLIYEATGRLINPGALPMSRGVIVFNVETLYNVATALSTGEPLTDKWVTVGGAVERASVVRVPIGTRISELLLELNITLPDGYVVIDGGPSMGKIKNPHKDVVTKTTKGILILPPDIQATISKQQNEKVAIARAETACCQCTRCTDMCPRALLGYPLEPHKMVRTAMNCAVALPKMVISATLCCGCGICESIACNQGISPRAVIANYKKLLSEKKMRFSAKEDASPEWEREYRMIPTDRWKSALGVLKFDKKPENIGERVNFSTVEIPLSQHIGIPSAPVVSVGDTVTKGQLIARAADGLSLPQHASISGRISYVDDRKIIINR